MDIININLLVEWKCFLFLNKRGTVTDQLIQAIQLIQLKIESDGTLSNVLMMYTIFFFTAAVPTTLFDTYDIKLDH